MFAPHTTSQKAVREVQECPFFDAEAISALEPPVMRWDMTAEPADLTAGPALGIQEYLAKVGSQPKPSQSPASQKPRPFLALCSFGSSWAQPPPLNFDYFSSLPIYFFSPLSSSLDSPTSSSHVCLDQSSFATRSILPIIPPFDS